MGKEKQNKYSSSGGILIQLMFDRNILWPSNALKSLAPQTGWLEDAIPLLSRIKRASRVRKQPEESLRRGCNSPHLDSPENRHSRRQFGWLQYCGIAFPCVLLVGTAPKPVFAGCNSHSGIRFGNFNLKSNRKTRIKF